MTRGPDYELEAQLSAVGLVRLDKGEGRAYQPGVAGRKVHFEIDLLA